MNTLGFANRLGYTDIEPFEVLNKVSDKCLEVRAMNSAREFEPTFIAGGFVGHCTNTTEDSQKWKISSDPNRPTIRIRLHKNGQWKDKNGNRYVLNNEPRRFYDYNF